MSSATESKDSAVVAPGQRLLTATEVARELGEHNWTIHVLLDFHGEPGVRAGKRRLLDGATMERLRGYVAKYREGRRLAKGA